MTEPSTQPFEIFKKWPDSVRDSVDQLCGNPFSLLVMATMHTYQDESFTATTLRDRFVEQMGTEYGVPRTCSFLTVMKGLVTGHNPLLSTIPHRGLRAQISRHGQQCGAAYAGPVLQFCLANPTLYPQDILGSRSGKARSASRRIGLYLLLDQTSEPLSSTDICKQLDMEKWPCNNLLRSLGKFGIINIEADVDQYKPSMVTFSNEYRELLGPLISRVNNLAVPGEGILDGLDMAEEAISNPTDFAYLLSLRQSQMVQQRRQEQLASEQPMVAETA